MKYLFASAAKGKEDLSKDSTKQEENETVGKLKSKENKHILYIILVAYKFLQVMVRSNNKIGLHVSQWMDMFFAHVS